MNPFNRLAIVALFFCSPLIAQFSEFPTGGGGASQLTDLSDVAAKTGSGTTVVMSTSPTLTTPAFSGAVDFDGGAVNDDDCTGQIGVMWFDDTDNAFEFCNADSGVPSVLGAGGGSGIEQYAFSPISAFFPTTDSGGYSEPGGELRRPSITLAIGEEVQWDGHLKTLVPTTCGVSWNFDAAGPTTNNVAFECSISCVSDTDDVDSQAFDTANGSGDIVVPGTAGNGSMDTWTLTNDDSCADGDDFVVQFERITPAGTSAGTDLVYVTKAWLE